MIPVWVVMWLPVAVTGAFGVLLLGAWLRGSGRGGADDGPNHDVNDDHGSGVEPGDDSGGHGRGRGRGGDD